MLLCLAIKGPAITTATYLIPTIPFLLISLSETLLQLFYLSRKVNKFRFFLIFSLVILLFFPINTDRYLWAANKYRSESILSRLGSYKSYEDCLKEIFLTKKKENYKVLNVATNWRTPVPCSNLDKTCNRIMEWGNYPKISNFYKPEIIIFNEKDEFNEFVKINKKYIENDYKKGTDKLNYIQENCGEINILVRDN